MSEFDKIVNRTTEARAVGGDSDSVKALEVGRYKFGRYGYWEVTLSQNGSVEVTNSNKGTKGTSFGIHFARFGALTFTDVDGGGHMLANQDELDKKSNDKAKVVSSDKAKLMRSNKKKAEAAKKVIGAKKLSKPGRGGKVTAVAGPDDDGERWTCDLCKTKEQFGAACTTCRRPRGYTSDVAGAIGQRTVEQAEFLRRMDAADTRAEISEIKAMAERPLQGATKAQLKKAKKMVGKKKSFDLVDTLKQIALAKQAEELLELK